jgi:hypothetical protein
VAWRAALALLRALEVILAAWLAIGATVLGGAALGATAPPRPVDTAR